MYGTLYGVIGFIWMAFAIHQQITLPDYKTDLYRMFLVTVLNYFFWPLCMIMAFRLWAIKKYKL